MGFCEWSFGSLWDGDGVGFYILRGGWSFLELYYIQEPKRKSKFFELLGCFSVKMDREMVDLSKC